MSELTKQITAWLIVIKTFWKTDKQTTLKAIPVHIRNDIPETKDMTNSEILAIVNTLLPIAEKYVDDYKNVLTEISIVWGFANANRMRNMPTDKAFNHALKQLRVNYPEITKTTKEYYINEHSYEIETYRLDIARKLLEIKKHEH